MNTIYSKLNNHLHNLRRPISLVNRRFGSKYSNKYYFFVSNTVTNIFLMLKVTFRRWIQTFEFPHETSPVATLTVTVRGLGDPDLTS